MPQMFQIFLMSPHQEYDMITISFSPGCPPGYRLNPFSQTCFTHKGYRGPGAPFEYVTNWFTAQKNCEDEGAHFATFESMQSIEWVAYQLKHGGRSEHYHHQHGFYTWMT